MDMVHGSTILSWMIASAVVLVSNKLVRDFMSLLFLMSSLMDTGMPSLYPDIFLKGCSLIPRQLEICFGEGDRKQFAGQTAMDGRRRQRDEIAFRGKEDVITSPKSEGKQQEDSWEMKHSNHSYSRPLTFH